MKKVLWLLIPIVSFSASLAAQDTVRLSLEDALVATLKNNKEIVLATLDEESATARFKQTNAVYLPKISLSYTPMGTNNPLNAFGFKLQQQSIAQSDFNPELLNDPSTTQNFMTKAEWQQPILNMDMLYLRKAAHEQLTVYTFKTQRTREYITYEVRKAYAQLQLAHQAEAVLEETLQTINAIYTAASNRFEKGLLQKSDVLNVRVQVASTESQLSQAKSSVQNASDYISLLMGAGSGPVYTVEPLNGILATGINEERIPENRADFQAMRSAISAQDMMINSEKMSYLPKLNGFAEYMINDADALGFGSSSYLVGAQLSWNLFNGMITRNKIEEHRVERNKIAEQLNYQKEQSQLELNKTHRQARDAQFSLQQQQIAVTQATEALRILQNRYQQGLVTTNDILQAQTQLSQQKLNHAQAVFNINTTQAYLQLLTSTSENLKK
jgi:outer membrane protein TolC